MLLINYTDCLAFLGLYITNVSYRGRGIGGAIFQYALELAGDRSVVLDSLTGKTSLYERSGFRCVDVKCTRIMGFVDHSKIVPHGDLHVEVNKVTSDNIDAVLKFDETLTKTRRSNYMKGWLLSDNSVSLRAVNGAGAVVGYVVIRPDHITERPISFKICGL